MSQYTNSHNHRRTDESTTNYHESSPGCPREIFALIGSDRMLVTIAAHGWRTAIRRKNADEYTVRYENAAGVQSGTLTINRRDARRLVAEQCQKAVWIDLQERVEWPEATTEVTD